MSPLVVAKTTRILTAKALGEFIAKRSDIHFIHSVSECCMVNFAINIVLSSIVKFCSLQSRNVKP